MSEKSLVQDIVILRETVAEYEKQYDEDTEDMARAVVIIEDLKAENKRYREELSEMRGYSAQQTMKLCKYREALERIKHPHHYGDYEQLYEVMQGIASEALEEK